jgi:hypothetical protein
MKEKVDSPISQYMLGEGQKVSIATTFLAAHCRN